jgi:hypothetical protein
MFIVAASAAANEPSNSSAQIVAIDLTIILR